jgi:hypothetical protein
MSTTATKVNNDSHTGETVDYAHYKEEKFEGIHITVDAIISGIAQTHLKIKDKKLLLIEVMQKFEKEILTKI